MYRTDPGHVLNVMLRFTALIQTIQKHNSCAPAIRITPPYRPRLQMVLLISRIGSGIV